ncbi:hypothetical protein KI387_000568, partial [Taxus chinensis]
DLYETDVVFDIVEDIQEVPSLILMLQAYLHMYGCKEDHYANQCPQRHTAK